MKIPTVHLNGTGQTGLEDQLHLVYRTLDHALDALAKATPHGRDYYVQEPGAWEQAMRDHEARVRKLQEVRGEIFEIFEGVVDQRRGS